ncbi:MAG TPA: hypothetical protein VF222_07155 [Nitrososphaeraceae archaeon]
MSGLSGLVCHPLFHLDVLNVIQHYALYTRTPNFKIPQMIEIKEDNIIRLESLQEFKHSSLILEAKDRKILLGIPLLKH